MMFQVQMYQTIITAKQSYQAAYHVMCSECLVKAAHHARPHQVLKFKEAKAAGNHDMASFMMPGVSYYTDIKDAKASVVGKMRKIVGLMLC